MSGVLFIVIVPRTEHEKEMRKSEKPQVVIEGDKYETASKVIEELKVNKRFGSLKSSIESYARDGGGVVLSKCKSTDCLHPASEKGGVLQKSNSELILGDLKTSLGVDFKNNVKASWDDIKQTIKPSKQKLKITGRRVTDVLATFHFETSLETILIDVLRRLQMETASWSLNKDDNFWQVVFSLESGQLCEEVLQVLKTFGFGTRYQSSVSVIPCALYYKSKKSETADVTDTQNDDQFSQSSWARFAMSVRSRTNLAQVLHEVRSDAALTFDWLFLLVVAAFVAAIGLVENSTVILVASMLISPLMGPITAGTLGTTLKDRSLQRMGLHHESLGLFLSLVIGFVFGLAICAVDERYGVGDWPTNEMMSRCEIRSLWVGVLVAIPSGAGVALAVLGEYTASLVGVAISASLLPPAVNAGLLWAMSLVHLVYLEDATRWTGVVKTATYSSNQAAELAALGAVSLCLTLVNIVCIFLAGVAVYKVKEVSPMGPRDLKWWRSGRESRRPSRIVRRKENEDTWELYRWCQASGNIKEEVISNKNNNNNQPSASIPDLRKRNLESFYFQQAPNSIIHTTSDTLSSKSDSNTPSTFNIGIEDEKAIDVPTRIIPEDNGIKSNESSNCIVEHSNVDSKAKYDVISKDEFIGVTHNVAQGLVGSVNTSINSTDSLEQDTCFDSIVSVYQRKPALRFSKPYSTNVLTDNRCGLNKNTNVPYLKTLSYDV